MAKTNTTTKTGTHRQRFCRSNKYPSMLVIFLLLVFHSFPTDGFSMTTERKTLLIAGSTGYIGKEVVRQAKRQGYHTVALVRNLDKIQEEFSGVDVVECDVTDPLQVLETMEKVKEKTGRIDGVISCLASRSGIKREAYAIDYQATLNCLEAGIACDAGHFVLLSAICVRKPLLQFQHAKLKFEAALQAQNAITFTIVRPTAFFKSVSGQLERLQEGKPFLMFKDSTRNNPIAETDLARFLVDSVNEPSRRNQIINLGGPDKPMTKIEQGEMLFRAIGKEPSYSRLPLWIFDVSINFLQLLADVFQSEPLENAAELGRIGRYYAAEDMVENENRYGTVSLQEYFNRIAEEGQDYDPYTSMSGILGLLGNEKDKKATAIKPGLEVPMSLAPNSTLPVVGSSTSAEGVY